MIANASLMVLAIKSGGLWHAIDALFAAADASALVKLVRALGVKIA